MKPLADHEVSCRAVLIRMCRTHEEAMVVVGGSGSRIHHFRHAHMPTHVWPARPMFKRKMPYPKMVPPLRSGVRKNERAA